MVSSYVSTSLPSVTLQSRGPDYIYGNKNVGQENVINKCAHISGFVFVITCKRYHLTMKQRVASNEKNGTIERTDCNVGLKMIIVIAPR